MAKLTLSDFASLSNQNSFLNTLNANFALVEAALEITLSRDGTSPNEMEADLDMNSNQILNLPEAVELTEPVRLQEFNELEEEFEDLETAINSAIAAVQALQEELEADLAEVADSAAHAAAAAASAAAALASETAAADSELNAETAETNAETAETNAETAETNAETAATNAASSASSASTSATNAATSATNAATSASSASTSATSAASSATAAAASYDSFDDRYLGAKAADPTLDNDGATLLDGALYFNTTANEMRVYDLGTTTWIPLPVADFLGLTDTPDNYTGDSLKLVRVNVGETALEFFTGAFTADAISFTPAGSIAATDVQAAIAELDSEAPERIADTVGAMVTGNTETLITVTYDDTDNTLDFVVNNDLSAYSNATSAFLTAASADALFLTPTEGNAAYQPLDSDLTSWAGVTRASGFDTFAATPSYANLAALMTDESFVLNNGETIVFTTDPGVDAFFGFDDSADQYEALTAAEAAAIIQGTNTFQLLDSDLTSWAGVTRASGFDTFAATPSSANLSALLTDEAFSMSDAELGAIASLTSAADKGIYFTGSGTAATYDLSAYGRTLANLADEAALEALLDTLPNLVSIQSLTVTLADAGANAFFGWDDVAGAYENLTAAEAEAIIEPLIDTLANLTSVQGRTVTLADAGFDVLFGWDDSGSAYKNFALADLTDEASPAAGDYVLIYGAEGDLRKTDWSELPGAGGGIDNVVEDTSPQLGGDLDLNGQYLFDETTNTLDTRLAINSGEVLISVLDNGAAGATLGLWQDSTSPADGDIPGRIIVYGGADDEVIGQILLELDDGSTGSEDTHWEFVTRAAGADLLNMLVSGAETYVETDRFEIFRTSDGATGPVLRLYHNSGSSAADNDVIASQEYYGRTDAPANFLYNYVDHYVTDVSAGTEDSHISTGTAVGGTVAQRMAVGNGVIIGSGTTFPGAGNLGLPGFVEFTEMAAPGAGGANTVRLYAKDSGGGITQLCAVGAGGTEVVICSLS